jgi:hypothetical protein
MAGLVVPAIHVLLVAIPRKKDVDARHKAGHDELRVLRVRISGFVARMSRQEAAECERVQ